MNDIKGYALAAEQYDRQEPPDGADEWCRCDHSEDDHGGEQGPDNPPDGCKLCGCEEYAPYDEEAEREHAIESQRREW